MSGNDMGLDGIIGVINTPFTEDDKIDTDSLRNYVHNSLDCGVVGFLVNAMAAEVFKLTFNERKLIAETVIDEVGGRVTVIGGASSRNSRERIRNTDMLIRAGCDGVLVNIPYTDQKRYKSDITEISDLSPGFLMIQDWDDEGFGIPIDVIVEVFNEVEEFKYLKVEVKPAGAKYTKVINATGGELHVSGGWAGTQMIEALDRGVNAFMPSVLLDVYNKIFKLHRDGNRDSAVRLFNELVPILSFSHQHIDISIHFNKLLVHRQNIFSTRNVRQPIIEFDKFHERVAQELVSSALELSSKLDDWN